MSDEISYALYVLAKFIGYSGWCLVGLKLWNHSQGFKLFLNSLKFGFIRMLIGILFGFMIFIAYRTDNTNLAFKYFIIYFPIRVIEWGILYSMISKSLPTARRHKQIWLWILGGILVSFAIDFLSPEGVKGHFCVGRCLC